MRNTPLEYASSSKQLQQPDFQVADLLTSPQSRIGEQHAGAKGFDRSDASRDLFMWKVTGPQGSAYLVGSMHAADPQKIYPLPKEMEQALKNSDQLVVELDLSDKSTLKSLASLFDSNGFYSGNDKIQNHISPETAAELKKYVRELRKNGKAVPANLAHTKPWLVELEITDNELAKAGKRTSAGIDQHFIDEAKAMGKPIKALETPEEQIKALSGTGEDQQDKSLLSTLKNRKEIKHSVDAFENAWLAGDTEMLENLAKDGENANSADWSKRIILDRNITMDEKIEKMLSGQLTPLVVVGALHMVGEDGIVSLLQKHGYSVEQVRTGVVAPDSTKKF